MADAQGLPDLVGAVGVDEESHAFPNGAPGQSGPGQVPPGLLPPRLADLDLDRVDPLVEPALELGNQGRLVVGREAAAAVDRHPVVDRTQEPVQRQSQQPCLEVPQRRVHCGEGHGHRAGTGQVANGPHHRVVRRGHVERRPALNHLAQLVVDERHAGRGAVGPADPTLAAALHLHKHERGGAPGQRAVALGSVGRHDVRRGLHPLDRGVGDPGDARRRVPTHGRALTRPHRCAEGTPAP